MAMTVILAAAALSSPLAESSTAAHRSGAIVPLERRVHEHAAAGHAVVMLPLDPSREQRPQPRLTTRLGQRGENHDSPEFLDGGREDIELQRLFGTEVGEEPTL